jgi:hypothetical protein
MIEDFTSQKKDKKFCKVALILLVGLASISGARKDLNQLLSLASDVHSMTNRWVNVLPLTETPSTRKPGTCELKERELLLLSSSEFPFESRVDELMALDRYDWHRRMLAAPEDAD